MCSQLLSAWWLVSVALGVFNQLLRRGEDSLVPGTDIVPPQKEQTPVL